MTNWCIVNGGICDNANEFGGCNATVCCRLVKTTISKATTNEQENGNSPIIERYRLTLNHEMIVDGKTIQMDEAKTFCVNNCNIGKNYTVGYKEHLLHELFMRFYEQIKEENNDT